ncbi:uncharacterized protein LOC122390384 isoform X1 [Amphibalanus amphitrite]|uniref:uncharacterized protein LOC122390384 isoform X1 n=1 Tax=Amphibalanus amphitrite TaxID=1232801 RepID=UPI001C92367A|nr:uncharacterized protein LOC122390384 isoform X1 [Amphibalanus amphitrite]
MFRDLGILVVVALLWSGGRWGSARLHQPSPDDWDGTIDTSDPQLTDFPEISNGSWLCATRWPAPRRRSARHTWLPEPSDGPLPLPDELESPEADREASLATLRRYSPRRGGFSVCCPAGEELTSPRAGTRRDGSLGILYADDKFRQMFFERSCRARADDEDSLAERRRRRRYRCVQQYSHSYAVYNVNGTKVLDYIRIRSGCKCEVKSKRKRKRRGET